MGITCEPGIMSVKDDEYAARPRAVGVLVQCPMPQEGREIWQRKSRS